MPPVNNSFRQAITAGYLMTDLMGIRTNADRTAFLTSKDASDAIAFYWRKLPPSARHSAGLGKWVMETFFMGHRDDRLAAEKCHTCAAQYICTHMVEELQ